MILGQLVLATANALINCRTGVMKISFGNRTVKLKIFHIKNKPLDYDEVQQVCLIEEIIDEIVREFSLEDLEMEYFAPDEDNLDLDRLIEQDCVMHESSLEDLEIECFTPSRDDLDFIKLLEQAKNYA